MYQKLLLTAVIVGYISTTFIDGAEVSRCYQVNSENYCFYTNSSLLSWDEAREFCERRNSTLPIITDKDVDNVFHQFIVSDSYTLIQNRSVWIAAHARPVNISDNWHWIDGRLSGKPNNEYITVVKLTLLSFIAMLIITDEDVDNEQQFLLLYTKVTRAARRVWYGHHGPVMSEL